MSFSAITVLKSNERSQGPIAITPSKTESESHTDQSWQNKIAPHYYIERFQRASLETPSHIHFIGPRENTIRASKAKKIEEKEFMRMFEEAVDSNANLARFQLLLKCKPAIVNSNGKTLLQITHEAKRDDAVVLLLENGENINDLCKEESDLFLDAAFDGSLELIRFFHRIGFPLDFQNEKDGYTALHFAAENNHLHIVDFLLASGANPSILNRANEKYCECRRNRLQEKNDEAIKILIARATTYKAVDIRTNEEVVKDVLDINAPIDEKGNTLLHVIMKTRCWDMQKCLLDSSADPKKPNCEGRRPYEYALKQFLSAKIKGDRRPYYLEQRKAYKASMSEMARQYSIDFDEYKACLYKHSKVARRILREALKNDKALAKEDIEKYSFDIINIDKPNNKGNTILHLAYSRASKQPCDVNKVLIKKVLKVLGGTESRYKENHAGQTPKDLRPIFVPDKEEAKNIEHLILKGEDDSRFDFNSLPLYTSLRSLSIQGSIGCFSSRKIADHCKQLEALSIGCGVISKYNLLLLLQNCSELKHLAIEVGSARDPLIALASAGTLKLEKLELKRLSKDDYPELKSLLQHNPQLIELDLNRSQLSKDMFELIGQHCPLLKNLDLRHSLEITADGVLSATQGCKGLTRLRLNGINGQVITDEFLQELIVSTPNLEELHLPQIKDSSVYLENPWHKRLLERCPRFKRFYSYPSFGGNLSHASGEAHAYMRKNGIQVL